MSRNPLFVQICLQFEGILGNSTVFETEQQRRHKMLKETINVTSQDITEIANLHVPVSVRDLPSVKVGSMIVIVNTILVLVGTRLLKIKS